MQRCVLAFLVRTVLSWTLLVMHLRFESLKTPSHLSWLRPQGHPAYTAMRALADNKGFISAMCLVKPKEDFPGGASQAKPKAV